MSEYNKMEVSELFTLYRLLQQYNDWMKEKHSWWDTDTANWLLDEINDSSGGVIVKED